jgi:hypothetical protein
LLIKRQKIVNEVVNIAIETPNSNEIKIKLNELTDFDNFVEKYFNVVLTEDFTYKFA